MFSPPTIFAAFCLYMALLFIIALWVERKAAAGKNIGKNPIIYALSSTVYLTAWTFYGSVGKAASTGTLFLAFYLGPTFAMLLGWIILRKMVRIKNAYRITSIADFISLRYNRSASLAALVTAIAIAGIVPYIALQLKAIVSTFEIITQTSSLQSSPWMDIDVGIFMAGFLILFTIVLGVRRVAPTERHQGIVVAMATESLVKLLAFLVVGIFVTYFMFGGFGDLFQRFSESLLSQPIVEAQTGPSFYLTWIAYLVLSMSAFMFLPRQFHMLVVENFHEKHIRTAMWLCPLYMLLITIFVLPIAMGGLLAGNPVEAADNFVLLLPLSSGQTWLSLLVFLGGFSASTGMIMVCSMTISTMFTNHLLLPVIEWIKSLGFLKRYLLQCRWIIVIVLILTSYWFERNVGLYFTLVDIGVISFAAVLQFVPAIIGGLFWKRGNKIGALSGMGAGFFLWFYTLILPSFVGGGLLPQALLENGPWGIRILRPEHLFGLEGFDPISHAVLWSMIFNVGLYLLGSLAFEQDQEEQNLAEKFVNALNTRAKPARQASEATIDLAAKTRKIEELFCQYFPAAKSTEAAEHCLQAIRIEQKSSISMVELAELYNEAEKYLTSSVGAAAARAAIRKSEIITPTEENSLQQIYSEIIAGLKLTPSELANKIDYYQEREKLLTRQARELGEKIQERDNEIVERKRAEEALRNSERRLADLIDFLPDATFAIDQHGKIIIWNRAAEEFTGVKAEDMLGKGDHEYSIPFYGVKRLILIDMVFESAGGFIQSYSNIKKEGDAVSGEAFTRSVKHGEAYLIGTAAPLYDSEGKIIGAIESIRDITERKQVEEELKKHRDHLEELVKERTTELALAKEKAEVANRTKSAFLANMSHELRTPLNAILGYAQILKQRGLENDVANGLNIIQQSGEHLLTLINDILNLSKIEAGRLELYPAPLHLPTFLEGVAGVIRSRAEAKGLVFTFEALNDLPNGVQADETRLREVLLNLLGNAVKFTDAGHVTLRVQRLDTAALLPTENRSQTTEHSQPSHALLRFEVRDTGAGILSEELERIFLPFEQSGELTRRAEGTGLGLAISQQLVRLMGGDLHVESEPGQGSIFWFEAPLPVVEMASEDSSPPSRFITGYTGPRRKVLVVDDIASNRAVVVNLLQPLGFGVSEATDGQQAIQLAQQVHPDLILMDRWMPVMDGIEAIHQIREMPDLQQVPVISVSASVSAEDQAQSHKAGYNAFLPKPVDWSRLATLLEKHLKLEWEYGEDVEAKIHLPSTVLHPSELLLPPEELAALLKMAQIGDLAAILEQAIRLETLGYPAFAGTLRALAEGFEEQEILALIKRHMEVNP